MTLLLFTDGSVNTKLGIGYGAYLAFPDDEMPQAPLAGHVKVKRFVNTSSTRLELQTLLWALSEIPEHEIILYTDSQNIAGLGARREKLEENDYRSRNGKRLGNHELYREFYKAMDHLNMIVEQVKGHIPSSKKSLTDRIFSLVDRASRDALRAYNDRPIL